MYQEFDSVLEKSSFLPGFFQLGVDCTQFTIPYMQKLNPTLENERDGSIVGKVSWIFDLKNNILLDCGVGDFDYDVPRQTMEHINILDKYYQEVKAVLEFDHGYFSLEAMHVLSLDQNKRFVFRLDEKNLEEFQNQLKPGEEKVVQFQLTVAQTREYRDNRKLRNEMLSTTYKIRFAKPIIGVNPDGSPKYVAIATNIFPKEATLAELINAYRDRWNAETSYDYLKNDLMIEQFYGNDLKVILRQIYAAWQVFNSIIPMASRARKLPNEPLFENGDDINWEDMVNRIDEVEDEYSTVFKKCTNNYIKLFCEDDPIKIPRLLDQTLEKVENELLPAALIRESVKQEVESRRSDNI
ncbi:MAG: hypothetical protein Q4A59_01960 [Erysipelotrichaceae bacterium]|nr:hypothetical protein [Erysipelotrichaceae bacterium]